MASLALLSTSISVVVSTATSLSTIYQTSKPVFVTTLISIASQVSTIVIPTTLTKPDVVMASIIAVPITTTQTLSQVLTNYSPQYQPSFLTSTVTQTITSTIMQPGQTYTYYAPTPATTTFEVTTGYPAVSALPTATITEIVFLLEDAIGLVYSTSTTTLPSNTNSIVFVPGKYQESGSGWSTWSDSQKAGLISGVILAFLFFLAIFILLVWCVRRRNIWLASEGGGMTGPFNQALPGNALVVPQAYWGPGPAGWGIRG